MAEPISQPELDDFLDRSIEAFSRAAEKQGNCRTALTVAGVRIDIEYAGEPLRDAFHEALRGVITDTDRPADCRILVYDSAGSGVAAPELDRPVQQMIGWRGDCWTRPGTRSHLIFHYSDHSLQIYDPGKRICVVAIQNLQKLPGWVFAAPLRTSIGLALQSHGAQLVHGAAVGHAEGAILITGHGGSGKSTTTLSCLKAGLSVLGDDYVAVRPAQGPGGRPVVYNVFSSLKLRPEENGQQAGEMDNRRKQMLFPFAQNDRLLLNEAPLLAFCAARIGSGNATLIRPMAAEHVSRIAYASTALQISGDDGLTYRRIRVAAEESDGCFELQLGADRAGVADAIAAFLDTKRPTAPALNRSASRLKLSVIIPVYNGAHFIGQAVESIVEQDYPGCEIIVVDDGSTDDLASALDRIAADVTLIRQSNRGPAAARNAGIKAASGELLAFLDADDLWPQARLELLLPNWRCIRMRTLSRARQRRL